VIKYSIIGDRTNACCSGRMDTEMKKQSKIVVVSMLVTFSMIFTGCSAANEKNVILPQKNAVMSQNDSVKRTDDY
jgi:hypothetical protein